MGFDASGTFTRSRGRDTWKGDAAANVRIMADLHDNNDNDIADGLSECLNRNGKGTPSTDISWGGRKITNLGKATQPGDAATLQDVTGILGWEKSKYISGADLDGRLNFTGTSGVNGITWTYANVSWVAKHAKTGETSDRLVMVNSVTPSTTTNAGDVFVIDDTGRVNNSGWLTSNLSWDGSAWRTISPGTGTAISYSGGSVHFYSNDVASITNPYVAVTLRDYFDAFNSGGSSYLALGKSASGKTNTLRSYTGVNNAAADLRWEMRFGDTTAETGSGYVGSNFYLVAYNNSGGSGTGRMHIARDTGNATFYGNITTTGSITSGSNFDSTSTSCVVSATNGGTIFLRPDGPTVSASGCKIDTSGNLLICEGAGASTGGVYAGNGVRGRAGSTGGYGSYFQNFNWNGTVLSAYAGTSKLGDVAWQCDYRIKKDIQPLPSVWEKIKALKPISYTQKAYEVWTEDDTVRWGFMAHEVQESLVQSAASGVKDGPEVQSPNLLAIIAALTKALQEAMTRIEALEARP